MIKTSAGQEFATVQEMRVYRKALVNNRAADYATRTMEIENLDLEIEKATLPHRNVCQSIVATLQTLPNGKPNIKLVERS